jgi:hypothetical protein
VRGREIDPSAEKIGQSVLKADHIEQGEAFGGVEFGN